jgi:hypothetical protein
MANAALSCNHFKHWKILLSVALTSKLHKLVLTQLFTITYIYIYIYIILLSNIISLQMIKLLYESMKPSRFFVAGVFSSINN